MGGAGFHLPGDRGDGVYGEPGEICSALVIYAVLSQIYALLSVKFSGLKSASVTK